MGPQVNASPSLSANTPADYDLKFRLLDDMLNIIDMEHANV
jgi:tubulin polyglutamylase TTLL9